MRLLLIFKYQIYSPVYYLLENRLSDKFYFCIFLMLCAEDAIRLYRKLLTLSPDESVVIVTIGHLSSLQALLQSLPDQISTSNGQKLVNEKVSH